MSHFLETVLLACVSFFIMLDYLKKILISNRLSTVSWNG